MKSGDYVKLLEPSWTKTVGQGNPPKGMRVTVGGETTFFEWGKVYKLSANTTYPGNPDSSTYPLMHTDFSEEINTQLEIQQTEE